MGEGPKGQIQRQPDGSYIQTFQLGSVIKPLESGPRLVEVHKAHVTIAGIKCFGTEDPGGEDEPYLVVSLISLNPGFKDENELVVTKLVEAEGVTAGRVFAESEPLGPVSIVDSTRRGSARCQD